MVLCHSRALQSFHYSISHGAIRIITTKQTQITWKFLISHINNKIQVSLRGCLRCDLFVSLMRNQTLNSLSLKKCLKCDVDGKGLQRLMISNPSASENLITVKELGEARRTCLAAKCHQHSLNCNFFVLDPDKQRQMKSFIRTGMHIIMQQLLSVT